MAKLELHNKAVELRLKGMSFSMIKNLLGISKGTLSAWLQDYPLSEKRIRELRDHNQIRIEKTRETKASKKKERLRLVYEQAHTTLGTLTDREVLIAGIFLYWGEGGKTKPYTTTLSNTDPAVLIFFLHWLSLLGVSKDTVKVRLQLYADMEKDKELSYWSTVLELPKTSFRAPYIKISNRMNLTYKQRFFHGTCNIMYDDRDIAESVQANLEAVRAMNVAPDPIV